VVRMWPKLLAVAASVVIIMGIFLTINRTDSLTETTLAQQHRTVTLPDGSTVKLNASSTVVFDEEWADERSIHLDGEAFFDVKKGSRFQVITDNGTVEVLGTSFNVFSREDDFKVACKTGKVRVSSDTKQVILTPNLATLKSSDGLVEPFSTLSQDDWTRGYFAFDDEPLENVFEELERQFGVTVLAKDSEKGRFTGEFSAEDLDTALRVICGPMDMDYRVDEQTVTISQPKLN